MNIDKNLFTLVFLIEKFLPLFGRKNTDFLFNMGTSKKCEISPTLEEISLSTSFLNICMTIYEKYILRTKKSHRVLCFSHYNTIQSCSQETDAQGCYTKRYVIDKRPKKYKYLTIRFEKSRQWWTSESVGAGSL